MTDWTPSQLPNTIPGWWDAADASTITESGGAVSAWASKVGSIVAEQATGSKQPVYSATGRNGLPSIEADGIDDVLVMSALTDMPSGTDESHIFAVGVYTDSGNAGYPAIASVGDRTTDAWPSGTRYSARELTVDPSENAGVDVWYDGVYSTASWLNTDRIVHGQIGGDKAYGIRIDGAAAQGSKQNQLLSIPSYGSLFAGCGPTNGGFWQGHAQEIIFINGAISKADRERIEGYLAHKWGLEASLPVGHPYKSAAPQVEDVPTTIFLKVGDASPWTVPSDWNSSDNSIECIGPGGDGLNAGTGGREGGGGGGYSKISNHTLTPGASVSFQVSAGGSEGTTWFGSTSTVLANGGGNAVAGGGAGAAAGTGTVTYGGGNGGNSTSNGGGGGGGAGGPDGAGAAGASTGGNTSVGGGGANGGSASAGVHGGNGVYGSSDLPGSGAGGDASGGTTSGVPGDYGYQQDYWRETATDEIAGPGGGGGGSRGSTTGGNGGGYGGGGGGGTNEGQGSDGIIVITYMPAAATNHEVLPTGIAAGSPTVGTPTLAQNHETSPTGIAAGTPTVGTPTVTEDPPPTNEATPNGVTAGSPTVGTPSIAQGHALAATGVSAGTPSVGTPTLRQDHRLGPASISAGQPTVGSPGLSQQHAVTVAATTAGAPTVGTPTIAQDHRVEPVGVSAGAPVVGLATLVDPGAGELDEEKIAGMVVNPGTLTRR